MNDYTQDSLIPRIEETPARTVARLRSRHWPQRPDLQVLSPVDLLHDSPLARQLRWPEIAIPTTKVDAVYLLQLGQFFKIGCTNYPLHRLQEINASLPVQPTLIMLLVAPYMRRLERALHRKFAPARANGEWFRLSDADILYLNKLANRLPKQIERIIGDRYRLPGVERPLSMEEVCDYLVEKKYR